MSQTPETLTVDELIDRYTREGRAEFAQEETQRAAERERLHAAFEAGASVITNKPLEVWDPIDHVAVPLTSGTVLTVATHEGDILIGQLSDNSHSIGVLHEEAHRWYTRKYFLPLALLCDPVWVSTGGEAKVDHKGQLKGLEHQGVDGDTAVAIQRLEALALADDRAIIPRGVKLLLREWTTAIDPVTGEKVSIPADSVATVTAAVADGPVDEFPNIPVEVDGRALELPFEVMRDLDPEADVLTLREQEQLADDENNRRRAMRRMFGVGLGVACLMGDAGVWMAGSPGARADGRRQSNLLSAIIPQMGLIYGYFSAGGGYWHELHGAALDLKGKGCAGAVRALGRRLDAIAVESARLWDSYESTYHRSVHTHWNETRHYRTDDKGKRHYTHSTWSKGYTTMWVEPQALEGDHHTVGAWAAGDGHRRERGERLTRERIFDLLESADVDAESAFKLEKMEVGFARDAALSALCAMLFSVPPAFYDEIVDAIGGGNQLGARARKMPYQKPTLLLAGAVLGVVLAERSRRRHEAALGDNKYELGHLLEGELKRVPGLSFVASWTEFFGDPAPRGLTAGMIARRATVERIEHNASNVQYTYGSGWDNGRRLDTLRVNAEGVRQTFAGRGPVFPERAEDLDAFLREPAHTEPLHIVLKNAVGTEVLDGQADAHETEAKGGSLRRAGWFTLPVWGAAVADLMLKAVRAG